MPTHVHLGVGREVVFIMKSVVHHKFSKGMEQFEDESLPLIVKMKELC